MKLPKKDSQLQKKDSGKSSVKQAFEKHSKEAKLRHEGDDLRWATHELVARHRAERLKCYLLADIGCGIGFQSLEFAKKCGRVLAVEIDERKLENARRNSHSLNIRNIEFIKGDALDGAVISQLKGAEIIFCDPERLPEEDSRSISSIKPDPALLINACSAITSRIAIELPPQIREIPFDCEREYASVDGKLNRLTIYLGPLKACERSAVVLPAGVMIQSRPGAVIKEAEKLSSFLYEADPAVEKAELLSELCEDTGAELYEHGKQAFFTSGKKLDSKLFKNRYKVLSECEFDEKEIAAELKKITAGKVELRFSVEPKEYWNVRNKYEGPLKGGKKTVSLFKLKGKAVMAESFSK